MGLARGIQTAIDLIYPPRCIGCADMVGESFGLCGPCWRDTPFTGGAMCDRCSQPLLGEASDDEELICDACLEAPPPWKSARSALLYKGRARRLVMALKHSDRQDIARPAAQWMARAGADLLQDRAALLVPIPLHWSRMMRRRYNQSVLLARGVAFHSGVPLGADVLVRPRATRSLGHRTRAERLAELSGAIAANPRRRSQITGRKVILVDDVMTSGATMDAASQACLEAGASQINVLVLARVAKDP